VIFEGGGWLGDEMRRFSDRRALGHSDNGHNHHFDRLEKTPLRFSRTKRMVFKAPDGKENGLECLQGRATVSLPHPSRKSRVGYAKPIWVLVLGESSSNSLTLRNWSSLING
jgi:hypothetical protein